jgi:hypothetical protein
MDLRLFQEVLYSLERHPAPAFLADNLFQVQANHFIDRSVLPSGDGAGFPQQIFFDHQGYVESLHLRSSVGTPRIARVPCIVRTLSFLSRTRAGWRGAAEFWRGLGECRLRPAKFQYGARKV